MNTNCRFSTRGQQNIGKENKFLTYIYSLCNCDEFQSPVVSQKSGVRRAVDYLSYNIYFIL